jgi:hypothetical protein
MLYTHKKDNNGACDKKDGIIGGFGNQQIYGPEGKTDGNPDRQNIGDTPRYGHHCQRSDKALHIGIGDQNSGNTPQDKSEDQRYQDRRSRTHVVIYQ